MLLWTNEIWLWYCTNIKLLNFVASQAIAEITNSFWKQKTSGFFLTTSVCECEQGFWKAWWNQFGESPPPLDTQSSLCGRQQLAASATHKDYCQRATTETRTKPEPRTTADPHGHNIQNTLSGPIRLHCTRSISLADHGTGTEER